MFNSDIFLYWVCITNPQVTFIGNVQEKIINSPRGKEGYLIHLCSDKDLKCFDVNRTFQFIDGGSLEVTPTARSGLEGSLRDRKNIM